MIRVTLTITCILVATAGLVARLIDGSTDTLTLPATTAIDTGVIFQNGKPLIHSYAESDTDGRNTFVGQESGNFAMGGSERWHGSYNAAIGYSSLVSNTTGFNNTAVAESSLKANTTGFVNTANGAGAMFFSTTGYYNTASGVFALWDNTTGIGNTVVGVAAGLGNTSGYNNTAIGMFAGYSELSDNRNVSGYGNVWVGLEAGPGTSTQLNNTVAVGFRSHPTASNQAVLGNSSITSTVLHGTITTGNKTGVTGGVVGQTCRISEITNGVVTGVTCS